MEDENKVETTPATPTTDDTATADASVAPATEEAVVEATEEKVA